MSDFFIFQNFNKESQAKEFQTYLLFYNIACKIEQQAEDDIVLLVQKSDEQKTKNLFDDPHAHSDLLNQSEENLILIAQQLDESNSKRGRLALQLLKGRIKTIRWKESEEERLKEEQESAVLSTGMYFFILLATFLYTIVGVVLAMHVVTYKRKLANGQRVYLYAKEDRKIIAWLLTGVALLAAGFAGYLFINVIFFRH